MKGVLFGTNTDRERHEEYLKHFFKEVDKGVHHILLGHTAPLILAGVEEEVALYRHVNSYPRLIEHAVLGSPDAFEPNELRDRAMIAREIPPPPKGAGSVERSFRDETRAVQYGRDRSAR